MKNCIYIADLFLPNNSAYSTHVLKMCDALSIKSKNVNLLIYNYLSKITFQEIKKKYLFSSKNKFGIIAIRKDKKKINFFGRIIFGYCAASYSKKIIKPIIITRSFYASLFLTMFKKNHFLEIHNEIKGLTKLLFIYFGFINSKFITKKIFISNKLSNIYNSKNHIILHDAVDVKNFNKFKPIKRIRNIGYVGSLYDGRGIDIILKLSKSNPDLIFTIIGKKKNDKIRNINLNIYKNLKILNFVDYSKIPNLLSTFDVLLMPYKKNVFVKAKNLNTADYCSPLKMFDYLAAGKLIISSKLSGINEILKNNTNSIIVEDDDILSWEKAINNVKKLKITSINRISNNAYNTSKKNTWIKRVNKIFNIRK